MSDTYETVDGSKIIPANDIAKYAEQLKRERDQFRKDYLDMKRERNSLIDQRDCAITIHESHLASSIQTSSILAEKHNEMLHSRNQWRECAEKLAEELKFERDCMPKSMRGPQIAMAHFNRLKGETK